jgi:hypothetical protein
LLKSDLDLIKKKGKTDVKPEDCVKATMKMVLEASLIDGVSINVDSFPGMELVEEI